MLIAQLFSLPSEFFQIELFLHVTYPAYSYHSTTETPDTKTRITPSCHAPVVAKHHHVKELVFSSVSQLLKQIAKTIQGTLAYEPN